MSGWSCPRNQVSPWDELPSEKPGPHTGKNPGVSHRRVKASLCTNRFRGQNTSLSESEVALGCGVFRFHRLGDKLNSILKSRDVTWLVQSKLWCLQWSCVDVRVEP